jgi:DNA polymerase-3 subunit alpha
MQATIGGIITAVRQIATKNGDKMAFVKIENKTGETELIIFPRTYEECQSLLVQDTIVLATGKLNAKDRDGKTTEEIKLLADSVKVVTAETAATYEPTGEHVEPIAVASGRGRRGGGNPAYFARSASAPPPPKVQQMEAKPKLYVHIKNPEDHEALLKLKHGFNQHPGQHEVILVLGEDKKSAIRLPFKVEAGEALSEHIASLYGAESFAVRA